MPKISVIMPSLNVADYIEQCMESVINQTLKDMEIIVVDAGSTDGTLEILKKYESQDNRVHIIHSDKRSYGYQVNLGISMAHGDYIGIVETDDYIELNMYEILYSLASQSQADYVKGSAERFFGLTGGISYTSKIEVFTKKEFAPDHGMITVNPSVTPELILRDYYLWTGLYKNDLIKSIRLNETPGAAYQDIGFLIQTFCKAQKAVYVDKIFYHYRQDNPNASVYNHKAFHYIVQEYQYADGLLQYQDEMWRTLSYCKMFRQTNQRIRLMAISGSVWGSAISDLQIISGKLKQGMNKNHIASEHLSLKEWSELELMIQDPIDLYDYYIIAETEKRRELSCLLKKLSAVDQIVVFGCGLFGDFVSVLLEINGIDKIEACCDNNSDLWGNDLQGKPIIPPEQAVRDYPQAAYIVANKAHRQEIKNQLVSMGIADDHIYAYSLDADTLLLSKAYLQSQ
ncbi:glycosyltransferase family 2 protein [Paenibacillus jilunlii]|uniref:Glycosyltransferase involved in cell wall bisynthesis n=1 Tax=Paenibacillus jilunlii TaxID=682956 RepID=A0A1G9VNR9_9BACL|nr:glycosyltransferase [Paenibacillus jilunlii]SDM73661.1 Glycosyltransferase involved in cell wall bisynthesis [Paenibacillus jilunlii]